MNWKEFFRPDRKKVILFVILFMLSSLFYHTARYQHDILKEGSAEGYGLPFVHYDICTNHGDTFGGSGPICFPEVRQSALIIDLIFWYLISCLIIWGYKEMKK